MTSKDGSDGGVAAGWSLSCSSDSETETEFPVSTESKRDGISSTSTCVRGQIDSWDGEGTKPEAENTCNQKRRESEGHGHAELPIEQAYHQLLGLSLCTRPFFDM